MRMDVFRLVAGHDAVIMAFNPGWTNGDAGGSEHASDGNGP